MWWILLFIFVVVVALLWPKKSLKERVIEAQEEARIASDKAKELYQQLQDLGNSDKN